MKKTVLFISIFIISLSFNANAQDENSSRGVRAGWQLSDYYFDGSAIGDSPLNSFYVGFFNENKIIPMLYFGSGLEYFQNGSNIGNATDAQFKQHIISVPVYLKFKIGPVFATGGAAANFKVAENYVLGGNKIEVPENLKSNVFDVPLHLGLGVKILMFTVEARYYWGMLDTFQNAPETNTQYFQIGGGISF